MSKKNLKADFTLEVGMSCLTYHRIDMTPYGYLYEVRHPMVSEPYYVAFKRRRDVYDAEMFPSPDDFGRWAFMFFDVLRAREWLDGFNVFINN